MQGYGSDYQEARMAERNRELRKIANWVKLGLAVLLLLILGLTTIYNVNEGEVKVITTFGKVSSVQNAGTKVKVPFIQKAQTVNMRTRQMTIGYIIDKDGNEYPDLEEATMITGDMNLINIDFYVEWVVVDPVKFLYASSEPENILRDIVKACARRVVGAEGVDNVLTTGKVEIQAKINELALAQLEEYDIGLSVDIKIQDAEPPTAEVIASFKSVENAVQGRDTALSVARGYRNETIPNANAAADKIKQDAESYKATRIAEANGEVARFVAMYEEYQKFPNITKTRMYLEMIEKIFPNCTIFIDASSNETQKLLPLDEFVNGGM